MTRFILLTFGFLGWAFWEMSGGSDFEPASERMARAEPVAEPGITRVDRPEEPQTAEVAEAPEAAEEDVTRVSLDLSTLQQSDAPTDSAPESEPEAQVVSVDAVTGVAINTDTEGGTDTPAIIPSLIAPGDAATAGTAADTDGALRTVSGSRVNVRGGPGTEFGIVGKLVEGDTVEIMEDNGDGWVRMRSVDTGEEGWMADFLLTSG